MSSQVVFDPGIKVKAGRSQQSGVHHGRIVEGIVRRSPIGISAISRRLDISRRTLYNWFTRETLSTNTIDQIGRTIGHDFSKEFPDIFHETSMLNNESLKDVDVTLDGQNDPIYYWMNRYIQLLEKFNKLLSDHSINNNDDTDGLTDF